MAEHDATNPKHIAIARRSAKEADEAFDNFLKFAMGMVDGRRFIYSVLVRSYVASNNVSPFSPDPYSTAFHCGEMAIGQMLVAAIMRICPDEYVQMTREANARDIADDTRRSRSDADSNRDDSGPVYVHPAYVDAAAGQAGGSAPALDGDQDYDPTIRDAEGDED